MQKEKQGVGKFILPIVCIFAAGASLTPSTEGGLTKPLLADTTATLLAAADAFDVHEHGSGGHHHHHHGHVSHVPHHHHAVPSGDLKQGVVLLVAMSVHTFLECMALGLMVRTLGGGGCDNTRARGQGVRWLQDLWSREEGQALLCVHS